MFLLLVYVRKNVLFLEIIFTVQFTALLAVLLFGALVLLNYASKLSLLLHFEFLGLFVLQLQLLDGFKSVIGFLLHSGPLFISKLCVFVLQHLGLRVSPTF